MFLQPFMRMDSAEALDVYLIETMRVSGGTVPLLERHLARLTASARALFGATISREALVGELGQAVRRAPAEAMLRLTWRPSEVRVELKPLSARPETLALSPVVVSSRDPLLAHKQSRRTAYELAAAWALAHGVGDALLQNEYGMATESTRFCVFAQHASGVWITPPLVDGLIDSVFRRLALETMGIKEASIPIHGLEAFQAWALGNAVHGWVPVRWVSLPRA